MLLRNVPLAVNRPYYFGWGLQSALKKPFTENDLANRVRVISKSDMNVNLYDFEIPDHYDRVLVFDGPFPAVGPRDFVYPSDE